MPAMRLAIVGAGPTGLEAALAAADVGLPFTLYEASSGAGAHVRSWGHVRLFTPWSLNASPARPSTVFPMNSMGWERPGFVTPVTECDPPSPETQPHPALPR